MSKLHRYRVLGLLTLPLLIVAVFVMMLAWSHTTGPPDALAADDLGITADDQSVGDSAVIVTNTYYGHDPKLGDFSIDVTYDSSQVNVSFLDITTADDGTGRLTTSPLVSVGTGSGQDNQGITDYSAIPIVGDGVTVSEITLMAIIGAALLVTGTITVFGSTGRRTRRLRQLDVPIASTTTSGTPIGTPTDPYKRRHEMGRTALNSLFTSQPTTQVRPAA